MSEEEEAAEGEAEAVAPAGSKRKTRTPHSDVGNYVLGGQDDGKLEYQDCDFR